MKTTLEYQEKQIAVRKRRGIRNLTLRINNSGTISVSAPWIISNARILDFLEEKKEWLSKHISKLEVKEKLKCSFESGEKILLQGQSYELNINHSKTKRAKIALKALSIDLEIWEGFSQKESKEKVKTTLEKFYKKLAFQIVNSRLEHFNAYYKLTYKNVTIKSLKSRWGSCSAKKNLNFNWRLVMAPPQILDYVVVHELCHLKQLNHSKRFWDLVNESLPSHKVSRKWLRENEQMLNL